MYDDDDGLSYPSTPLTFERVFNRMSIFCLPQSPFWDWSRLLMLIWLLLVRSLNSDFDLFYTGQLKHRLDDCFSMPVSGIPGRTIIFYDRVTDDCNVSLRTTGRRARGLNISSHNYLSLPRPVADVLMLSRNSCGC